MYAVGDSGISLQPQHLNFKSLSLSNKSRQILRAVTVTFLTSLLIPVRALGVIGYYWLASGDKPKMIKIDQEWIAERRLKVTRSWNISVAETPRSI